MLHLLVSPGEFYASYLNGGLSAALESIGISGWMLLIPVALLVALIALAIFVPFEKTGLGQ